MDDGEDEGAVLAQMLALADQLARSDDALLAGQYAYLRARVAALIELRAFGDGIPA